MVGVFPHGAKRFRRETAHLRAAFTAPYADRATKVSVEPEPRPKASFYVRARLDRYPSPYRRSGHPQVRPSPPVSGLFDPLPTSTRGFERQTAQNPRLPALRFGFLPRAALDRRRAEHNKGTSQCASSFPPRFWSRLWAFRPVVTLRWNKAFSVWAPAPVPRFLPAQIRSRVQLSARPATSPIASTSIRPTAADPSRSLSLGRPRAAVNEAVRTLCPGGFSRCGQAKV